jgi:Protein of unknown function (DUF642)
MYKPFLAILIALAGVNVRADLIANGSFETTSPVVPAGSFNLYTPGQTGLTGWTIVGGSGTNIAVVNGTFTEAGISFPAESGSNWVDLTGLVSNSSEGVAQTIATNIGDSYTLTFWVGNVDSPSTGFGVTSTADVSANSTSLGAFTNNCTTCTTTLAWEQFSNTFTATSTSTTLTFLNGDPTNDNSNGLDNVSLVDNGPSTVPEPSLIVLLGSALLGLAGWRQWRSA